MAICIVCKQTVTPNTGIQCQGSCSVWVHYGCLDYVTDDGHKMVHEPYKRSHMYSDVCVVTQLNDNDKKQTWNNNYDALSDQYVNMNETASQVTQETATKSVSQGPSIYKSLSLGMTSWADTDFYGLSARPIQYIPCGNVPHIILPTPYPIKYFPIAIQYGENTNMVDVVNASRLGYNRMNPHEKLQGEKHSPTSIATETDDYNVAPVDSNKRKFPAVSYKKPNSHSKSNINEFEFCHKKQHPYMSYHSRIPLFHCKSPILRHASTEAIDFEYFNTYNYSDYINLVQRKSHLYNSKSITKVAATEPYGTVYGRGLVSPMNPYSLSNSLDECFISSADLAALNAIKYDIAGMHKWMSSSKHSKKKEPKHNKKKEKKPCADLQGSELPDILDKKVSQITAKIKVSLKQSKSAPLYANPRATLKADHLKTYKSVEVLTDKMVENVPVAAECQTSEMKNFSSNKKYTVISTNTSEEKSTALLISKSVGSSTSKLYLTVDSKLTSSMDKKEQEINNSLAIKDARSCPSCPHAKCKEEKNTICKNLSGSNCRKIVDTSVGPDEKMRKSIYKKSENLAERRNCSWTKLTESKLQPKVSKEQINKIFGKLLPEELEEPSSENVLTNCVRNVLSTFEMLSSQICDIFYSRKKDCCSSVRSEGIINIVHETTNVFEKKQECLTVKLMTFRNN